MPYPYPNPYAPYSPQQGYGAFNPNPYGQPQQAPQTNTYAFVNGIEGAKSFPMGPNQTVMLMDSDQPIAYMKQSNNMGQATIKYFRLVETSEAELRVSAQKQAPSPEYATKAELDALARKIEELSKPKAAPEV